MRSIAFVVNEMYTKQYMFDYSFFFYILGEAEFSLQS